MTNILGLHFGHDGAAAVFKDGKLVTAISNERISRQKKAEGVTREMIDYVLDSAGLKLSDIGFVAFSYYFFKPDNYVKMFDPVSRQQITSDILMLSGRETVREFIVQIGQVACRGALVHHHICHAASAFYTSDFNHSAIFTLDASFLEPEGNSLFSYGEGNKIHHFFCPGMMIGTAYSLFTELLGLGPAVMKAGTMMALAEFGKPHQVAVDNWKCFAQSWYERTTQPSELIFVADMWAQITGRPPHEVFERAQSDSKEAMNIAASMEYIFENSILDRAIELHTKTRNFNDDNLCLGGGSFLNSNANMLLKKTSPFKNIHLFPACGDDGAACGAAMYIGHHHLNAPRVRYEPREYMYLGREYTMPESGEPYNSREVAQAIADGKIIAFFQGRSEYGPRALGHRSLLADPRNKAMKETINSRVKHREWFRPFAPVVIEEKASQWFDLDFKSKLMLFIAPVRDPEKLPAISHVDNSARLQTVAKDDNPELYELLTEFDNITGVPVLLNTSLNDNNEPLVETPQDALNFFARADIDLLVLGNRVHRKQR